MHEYYPHNNDDATFWSLVIRNTPGYALFQNWVDREFGKCKEEECGGG